MPPTKLTSTKRFAVRLSLVTGSTLAAIIGAQSLASLDRKTSSAPDITAPVIIDPSLAQPSVGLPSTGTQSLSAKDAAVHAPPVITILRHSSQNTAPANASIKPPEPVQIAAPQPIIVQAPGAVIQVAAPAQPSTRSSR